MLYQIQATKRWNYIRKCNDMTKSERKRTRKAFKQEAKQLEKHAKIQQSLRQTYVGDMTGTERSKALPSTRSTKSAYERDGCLPEPR